MLAHQHFFAQCEFISQLCFENGPLIFSEEPVDEEQSEPPKKSKMDTEIGKLHDGEVTQCKLRTEICYSRRLKEIYYLLTQIKAFLKQMFCCFQGFLSFVFFTPNSFFSCAASICNLQNMNHIHHCKALLIMRINIRHAPE